jgi:hypothetical protein
VFRSATCSCHWAAAAEREAGYILLSAMCAAAHPCLLAGRDKQHELLQLLAVALGPSAAEALEAAVQAGKAGAGGGDGAASSRSGMTAAAAAAAATSEADLAVACWWRAAALQALSAYALGVMGKGLADDTPQQVWSLMSRAIDICRVLGLILTQLQSGLG